MAQCVGQMLWWQASVHHSRSKLHTQAPLFSRSVWEDFMALPTSISDYSSYETSKLVVCFRDDDCPPAESEIGEFSVRTKLQVKFSPWAVEMLNGYGTYDPRKLKESTGGPDGGGNGDEGGGGDGDGDGDGEGDDEGGEYIFLLPLLTLAFAAFHLGYCIAVWIKDSKLDSGFFRTGLGLFCLLALSAVRLNSGGGVDAYILGLGASLGVMAWTGERCVVKKEGSPAGIVALFAASMALMFTAALYHNI